MTSQQDTDPIKTEELEHILDEAIMMGVEPEMHSTATSIAIERIEAYISSKVNQEVIKELEGILQREESEFRETETVWRGKDFMAVISNRIRTLKESHEQEQ